MYNQPVAVPVASFGEVSRAPEGEPDAKVASPPISRHLMFGDQDLDDRAFKDERGEILWRHARDAGLTLEQAPERRDGPDPERLPGNLLATEATC